MRIFTDKSDKIKKPGATEAASDQGSGKGEAVVLPEAKGGTEGCQIKIQREGAAYFRSYLSAQIFLFK